MKDALAGIAKAYSFYNCSNIRNEPPVIDMPIENYAKQFFLLKSSLCAWVINCVDLLAIDSRRPSWRQ